MDSTVIIFVLLALALGALIGWLLGSRSAAAGQGVADSLRLQLDAVREERDTHARAIETLRGDHGELAARHAGIVAAQAERDAAHQRQLQELETKFAEVGGLMLERAEKKFLERADQRFKESEATSDKSIKAMLQPVEATLKRYEDDLKLIEQSRRGAYDSLKDQIELLRDGQEKVASEALRLRTALRSSTVDVGRWGEEQCRNVLERAGLQEGIDFEEQVSNDLHDDFSKPDFIVRLPGNRKIIIDVKCSLDAFIGASDATDEVLKSKLLDDHAKNIRNHARTLAKRSYQDKYKGSATFVVMFVPGENFLHAAVKGNSDLLAEAHRGKVIVVGPTNLMSLVLNVAAMRDQARLAERAEQIGELGRKLYDNLATLGKNSKGVGNALRSLLTNWNTLVGTLDGHWLSTARKFDEYGVGKLSENVRGLDPLDMEIKEARKLIGAGNALVKNDNPPNDDESLNELP